jgi:hypothetical protein
MSHPVSQWTEKEEREYVLDLLRRRNILRETNKRRLGEIFKDYR